MQPQIFRRLSPDSSGIMFIPSLIKICFSFQNYLGERQMYQHDETISQHFLKNKESGLPTSSQHYQLSNIIIKPLQKMYNE
jgi:hypothetical protein